MPKIAVVPATNPVPYAENGSGVHWALWGLWCSPPCIQPASLILPFLRCNSCLFFRVLCSIVARSARNIRAMGSTLIWEVENFWTPQPVQSHWDCWEGQRGGYSCLGRALIHLLYASISCMHYGHKCPYTQKKGGSLAGLACLIRFLLLDLNFAPKACGLRDGFEFQGKSMAVPRAMVCIGENSRFYF